MKVSFENFRILIPRKDDGYDTLQSNEQRGFAESS